MCVGRGGGYEALRSLDRFLTRIIFNVQYFKGYFKGWVTSVMGDLIKMWLRVVLSLLRFTSDGPTVFSFLRTRSN